MDEERSQDGEAPVALGSKLVKCLNRSHQLSKAPFTQCVSLIALNSFVTLFIALQVILEIHEGFYI